MTTNARRRFAAAAAAAMTWGPARWVMAQAAPATPAHLAGGAGPFATQPWDVRGRIDAGRYTVERVVFPVGGVDVVGNLFLPTVGGPRPAVAIVGPVAFVKEQAPLQYASRLAKDGVVALIFDPRHHGESGGEPRRFESRRAKVDDLRAATAYLGSRPEVDPARLHLLGICQGVNWAAEAAADEPRVRSVTLVAGHYLMPETAVLYLGTPARVEERIARARESRAAFEAGGRVDYIPIVSLTDPDALLPARPIHDFYYRWADRGPFAAHTGLWENRITRMSEAEIWGHRIDEQLARLDKPVLMIHGDRAASGPQIPRRLFERIASPQRRQLWLDGRNQIQFYQDPTTIDAVVPSIAAFVQRAGA